MMRCLRMYGAMVPEQIYGVMAGSDSEKVRLSLQRLAYLKKIFFDRGTGCFRLAQNDGPVDKGMLKALWVLSTYIDGPITHSVCDYPVKLCFVRDGVLRNVVYVGHGEELLIGTALRSMRGERFPSIVILESRDQLREMGNLRDCSYCTVSLSGKINYLSEADYGK